MDIPYFVYPFLNWWVCKLFPLLAITNNATMAIHVQVFVWTYIVISFWYIPKYSLVVELPGHIATLCLTFWGTARLFLKWLYHFTFPQQCLKVPISLHLNQHLWFSFFVKWYFVVVLTCVFLIPNDAEHLFLCLLVICISSLEKCLFKSFAYFWIGLFIFLLFSFKS